MIYTFYRLILSNDQSTKPLRWIAMRLVRILFCLAIWYQRFDNWYFIITDNIMVFAFHGFHVSIDFTIVEKKIILIIIDVMVVAMNTWDIASDIMQSAIDVRPIVTNSNAAQPNYDHSNRVIAFSHLIFVFWQAINHLSISAGICSNWNCLLSNWYYASSNRFYLYLHRCYPNSK